MTPAVAQGVSPSSGVSRCTIAMLLCMWLAVREMPPAMELLLLMAEVVRLMPARLEGVRVRPAKAGSFIFSWSRAILPPISRISANSSPDMAVCRHRGTLATVLPPLLTDCLC